ncbi:MAG: vWA domain-containing protein [Acidimicrobiales bacterium]
MTDVAEATGRFALALRHAGVPVTPEQAARLAYALTLAPPGRRSELYWLARVSLVSEAAQLETFDRVFAQIFAGMVDVASWLGQEPPAASPSRRRPPPLAIPAGRPAPAAPPAGRRAPVPTPTVLTSAGDDPGDDGNSPGVLAATSAAERLRHRDFASLDESELLVLRELTARLAYASPPRPSRRRSRAGRGDELDVRATLRAARRTGGHPLRPVHRRRRTRPRRLVLLCDVSGSMEPYGRAYLRLMLGGVGGARAEAFVFATRLTRVTRALAHRRPDVALERAGRAAPDWSGGTRLGEALRTFNDSYGRRGVARGAVVVILTAGWHRGDPALVAREMERLGRLAHRVVWVNPRKSRPGYEPLAGGMAAALPHVDRFLAGQSLAAFEEVLAAIRE